MLEKLLCPSCESDKLIVRTVESFWLNSGEFFCHSVKEQDATAQVSCMNCGWGGMRIQVEKHVK